MPTIDKRGFVNDGTQDLNIAGNLTVNGASTVLSNPGRLIGDVQVWNGTSWAPFAVSTVATWWVDPANSTGTASDSNNGTSSATPLLTLTALLKRVALPGGVWIVNQNTTVNIMSDTPTNTDLVAIDARSFNGAILTIQSNVTGGVNGFRAITSASTFTSSSMPNRGYVGAGTLANCVDTVNSGNLVTANNDLIVWDSTALTYSWIRAQSGSVGGVYTSMPLRLPALGSYPTTANYGNTDAYQVVAPVKVNITQIRWSPDHAGAGATQGKALIKGLWFTGNSNNDSLRLETTKMSVFFLTMYVKLCRFDIQVETYGEVVVENCDSTVFFFNAPNSYNTRVFGGMCRSFLTTNGLSFVLDGDVIVDTLSVLGGGALAPSLCVQSALNLGAFGSDYSPTLVVKASSFVGTPVTVWGAGTVAINSRGGLLNASAGSYASTFTLASSFTLNGQSLAASYNRITAALTGNISCTFANVDAQSPKFLFDPPSGALVGAA